VIAPHLPTRCTTGRQAALTTHSSRAGFPARILNGKYRASCLVCTIEIALSETKGDGPQNKKNIIDTSLNGTRVLVVEHDPFLWLELSSILQIGAVEIVACCRNVKGGLVAVEQNGLAAAILDVRLGRATIASVARELAERGTPIIFCTGQVKNGPSAC
jgi:hypothetical protein